MIKSDKLLLAELPALEAKDTFHPPWQLEDWGSLVTRPTEAKSLITSLSLKKSKFTHNTAIHPM